MYFRNRFIALCFTLFWAWTASVWASENALAPVVPGYRVGVSDELNFRFYYVPELNTIATVRSDGRVTLPLVGELQVDGLTLAELTERVERLISAHVRRPLVIVNVQGSAAQRIFVGGEVVLPGVQPLLGPLTVLQAVMAAQGLKDSAQPRQVIVLRRGPGGTRTVLPVDLAAAMSGRDLAQDLQLQSYDAIIVPRSGIADIGLWVDQYVKRVLPFSLGFNYTINRLGAAP